MKNKILGILIVLSLFLTAIPAKASTLDDLMAQVKSLQNQVSSLQNSLSALALNAVDSVPKTVLPAANTTTTLPATTTPITPVATTPVVVPVPVLNNTINIGTTSSDVKKLQSFLIEKGLLAPGNTTGYYGKLTTQAVKQYQTKNSLSVTGNIDTNTLAKINGDTSIKIPKTCEQPALNNCLAISTDYYLLSSK
jgi:peptidoglycan hydrolase-like protein with peptidoglycan-binding domain